VRLLTALLIVSVWAVAGGGAARAQDSRALVRLPDMMQEHMLANMRDHLVALSEILGNLAESKFDAAGKLAEQRLGMSSLERHGASHMAPLMPKPMQDIGTSMHRAASRFAIVAQNAAVTRSFDDMRAVFRALHEVTATCAGCHAAYRIR
jgi:cytochrome c556